MRKAEWDGDVDVLRDGVRALAQELMEIEITQHVGAERYERGAERTGERNGYRDRTWDTRVGSIELRVPRVRDGGYYPALLEPGIASALTSRLVDDALERGVRTVFLSAFHPSIYERLGFCRIGSALIAVGGHEEVLPSGGREISPYAVMRSGLWHSFCAKQLAAALGGRRAVLWVRPRGRHTAWRKAGWLAYLATTISNGA